MSPSNQSIVENVVKEMVSLRQCFTGEDVYKRIHNKHIRNRPAKYSDLCTADAHRVSTAVRKMFNSNDAAFTEYGSTIVPKDGGPVVYFPLPHHAKVKVSRITDLLAN